MKRAVASLLTGALVFSTALTGCGGGQATASSASGTPDSTAASAVTSDAASLKGEITFFWWGTQVRNDATTKVCEMFEQKYPGVKVTPTFQSFDGYYKKLSMNAAANSMPDVFQFKMGDSNGAEFMDKKLVGTLDDSVANKLIDTSNIDASSLSCDTVDGKLYGIPLGTNTLAMVCDPDLYKQAGITIPEDGYDSWDAVKADAEKLKAVTGAYGLDDIFTFAPLFNYYWCREQGEEMYGTSNILGFTEKTFVDFYTMKKDWMKAGLIPPLDVSSEANNIQIEKGKAGMQIIWTNVYGEYCKTAGKKLTLIPLPEAKTTKAMSISSSQDICMSASTENKPVAAAFINYIINDIDANNVLNGERGIPVSSKVRDSLKASADEYGQGIYSYIEKVSNGYTSKVGSQAPAAASNLSNIFKDLEQMIVYDKETPAEAYQSLVSQVSKLS